MDIGKRVRSAREARGMTQEELARRAGVPLNRVGRIETGTVTDPHYSTLTRIAGGLDVSVGDLLKEPVAAGKGEASATGLAADPSPGDRRILEERRLRSALHPFTTPIEARTRYWQGLAESRQVNMSTLEYATREIEFTTQSFKALVDAANAERWSEAEWRLLVRVYESINGPYHEAWAALMRTYAESFARSLDDPNVMPLRRRGDKAMRELEEAKETARVAS